MVIVQVTVTIHGLAKLNSLVPYASLLTVHPSLPPSSSHWFLILHSLLPLNPYLLYTTLRSLYSSTLHILDRRPSTVEMSSLMIFFLSLLDIALYHFCRRHLPWRLNRSKNWIYASNKDIS